MEAGAVIVSREDRKVLGELARRVAQIAAQPIQAERAAMWKDFNALRPRRPMVLAFPEGGWRDLCTEADCRCQDQLLRSWELSLRRRIFHAEHINDDQPVTDFFNARWELRIGDYGLVEQYHQTDPLGSHVWDAPVKTRADLAKLHPRRVEIDRQATRRALELANDLFGDILRVRLRHHIGWPAPLTMALIKLRGLAQVMLDIYDDPGLLHEMMAFLRDDKLRELELLQAEGVLSLNNGPDDYVGSGGIGCTDELPASDFAGQVRLRDLWGFGESQEFVHVAPEHWERFVLAYQLPILERFGLNHYGCCEPLDGKFNVLLARVPRLRRLSISPWCDPALAAEKLADRCIFSWKPNPAMICAPRVDWEAVEKTTRRTLAIARSCAVEMVMKDTHTFAGDAARIGRWVRMALHAAEET